MDWQGLDVADVDVIVTPELVEKAIKRFGPYKGAGTDGIFPKLLQSVINSASFA